MSKKFLLEGRRKVQQKKDEIKQQRDAIAEYVNELCDKAETMADDLIGEHNGQKFMSKFKPVMSSLEEISNNLFMIQASLPGDDMETELSSNDEPLSDKESGQKEGKEQKDLGTAKQESNASKSKDDVLGKKTLKTEEKAKKEEVKAGGGDNNMNIECKQTETQRKDEKGPETRKRADTDSELKTEEMTSPAASKKKKLKAKPGRVKKSQATVVIESSESSPLPKSLQSSKGTTPERSATVHEASNQDGRKVVSPTPSSSSVASVKSNASHTKGKANSVKSKASSVRSKVSTTSSSAEKLKSKSLESLADYGLGPEIQTLSFQNGATTEVLVTEVMSPSYFWAQPVSDAIGDLMTEMEIFNERLQAEQPGYSLPVQPLAGMVVSARFTQDEQWYRARITGIYCTSAAGSEEPLYELDVLYIDYGNRERLTLDRIRPLMSSFSKLPAQAFVCSLSQLAPAGSTGLIWPLPAIEEFGVNVCGSRRFTAVIHALQECPLIFIELYYPEKVLPQLRSSQESAGPVANIMVSLADVMINKSRGRKTDNEYIAEKYERAITRNPTVSCGPQHPGVVSLLNEYQVHALQCPHVQSVQQTFKARLNLGQPQQTTDGGLPEGSTALFPTSVPAPTRVTTHRPTPTLSPLQTSTPEKKSNQPLVAEPRSPVDYDSHSAPTLFHLPADRPSPTYSTSSKTDVQQPAVTAVNTTDHQEPEGGAEDSNINNNCDSIPKKDSFKEFELLTDKSTEDAESKLASLKGSKVNQANGEETEPEQAGSTSADWYSELADETFDILLDQEMEKEVEHTLEVNALENPDDSGMLNILPADGGSSGKRSPEDNEETVCYDPCVSEAAGDGSEIQELSENFKRALAFDSASDTQGDVKEDTQEEATPEIPLQQRLKEFGLPSKLPKACGYANSFSRWMSGENSVTKNLTGSSQSTDIEDISKLTEEIPSKPCSEEVPSKPSSEEVPSKPSSSDVSYEELTGSTSVQQYKTHEITLPEDVCVNFLLSFVESPSSFWVHLVNETSQVALDTLMAELNDYYKSANKVVMKKFFDDYELKVFDVCCAKYTEDNRFYRAEVVGVRYEMEESGKPMTQRGQNRSSEEKQISSTPKRISRVKVFYIDFGNSEWVSRKLIYPLPPKFLNIPPQALCCKLADVHPVPGQGDDGDEGKGEQWPKSVTKKFVELTGFKKPLLGYVIGPEAGALVSVSSESPLVLCVVDTSSTEDLWVNEELVRQGLAISPSMSALPKGYNIPPEASAKAEPEDIPADWNPMVEDYLSIRNSYDVDIDDAQVALTGYKTEDDNKICANFNRPGGCRREMCPYLHQKYSDFTTDKKEVFCINDSETKMTAPEEGSWVAVELSAIFNPGHFYAQFPFGTKPIIEIMKEESLRTSDEGYAGSCTADSLDNLMNALNEEYKGSLHRNTDLTIFALGEVVVAKFSEDSRWYRARVTDSNPDQEQVKVFYIDYGNAEWLPEREIRVIKAEYTHLPPQAIECFLPVDPLTKDGSWPSQAKEFFREMAEGKVLFAHVLSRGINNIMSVELYDTEDGQDTCINNLLVENRHGRFVPAFPPKTETTSEDKPERSSPVYIPG